MANRMVECMASGIRRKGFYKMFLRPSMPRSTPEADKSAVSISRLFHRALLRGKEGIRKLVGFHPTFLYFLMLTSIILP
jgi:hypothetical protein